MDEKFNQVRFADMFKENYFNDPNKFVNQPNSGGGYQRGDRGYRRGGKYEYHERGERDERKRREYVDLDDPNKF